MSCKLSNTISHQGARDKFKEATVPCSIFAHKETGMSVLGIICANCCIRTYQVIEKRAELLRDSIVDPKDIKLEPDCFVKLLPGVLREYGEVLPKECGRNWTEISKECARCKTSQTEPIIAKVTEATEMRYVGRNDLRTPL
jgi:hypothetical protein